MRGMSLCMGLQALVFSRKPGFAWTSNLQFLHSMFRTRFGTMVGLTDSDPSQAIIQVSIQ